MHLLSVAVLLLFLLRTFYMVIFFTFVVSAIASLLMKIQTAILTLGLSLERQPFIFYCPIGISTTCPEQ